MTSDITAPDPLPFAPTGVQFESDVDYMRYMQAQHDQQYGSLPSPTTETRALAGTPQIPGEWRKVTRLWGPKVLIEGQGPVLAAELVTRDGIMDIVYIGGQIEPALEQCLDYVSRGLPLWFRYVYNVATDPKKRSFYSAEQRFQAECPPE